MIGERFGNWLVIAATDKKITAKKLRAWICQCQCGRKTKRLVAEYSLRNGKSKSCNKCPDKLYRKFIEYPQKQNTKEGE